MLMKKQFDLDKYPGHIIPRVLEYGTMIEKFNDAETYPMPLMFIDDNWETMKKEICNAVASYAKNK